MHRYFIEMSYKGSRYHGWQRQRNAASVQGVVEEVLKTLTRGYIKTTGAGRTDTGVHARFYVAHFDSDDTVFTDLSHFLYSMNALLPEDIAVHDAYPVIPNAHARYSALSRTYAYTISLRRDPFDTEFSWYHPLPLDADAMNKAAARLYDYTDFTSFSKLHSNAKTNICHIMNARWEVSPWKMIFMIRADRFLRNMVRSLVGTMVDIGRGKTGEDDLIRILEGKNRSLAGYSVPAAGLALTAIEYPGDIRIGLSKA